MVDGRTQIPPSHESPRGQEDVVAHVAAQTLPLGVALPHAAAIAEFIASTQVASLPQEVLRLQARVQTPQMQPRVPPQSWSRSQSVYQCVSLPV